MQIKLQQAHLNFTILKEDNNKKYNTPCQIAKIVKMTLWVDRGVRRPGCERDKITI